MKVSIRNCNGRPYGYKEIVGDGFLGRRRILGDRVVKRSRENRRLPLVPHKCSDLDGAHMIRAFRSPCVVD